MTDPFLQYLGRPTRERYTQFVVSYMPVVERLVRRLVSSVDLADDIIQETFLHLGRKKKLHEQIQNPRSYVLGTAFHLIQRHLRSAAIRARHEEKASRTRHELCPSVSDEAIARESIQKLYEAIDSLPASLRAAMHLRAIEGLSYQEISRVTGCSVKAVSVQISRARKHLKTLLGDQFALALIQLEELGPDRWLLKTTTQAGAFEARIEKPAALKRRPSPGPGSGLPVAFGILCLCGAVLGLLYAGGRSRFHGGGEAANLVVDRGPARSPPGQGSSIWPTTTQRAHPNEPIGSRRETPAGHAPFPVSIDEPSSEKEIPTRNQKEGGADMKLQASFVAPALLTLGLSAGIGGAEIGDTDGDGRLSIADVMHLHDGLPPAPGSLDGFERFPCFSEFIQDSAPDLWLAQIVPPAIYLESLRRNVPGSLPHWDSVWTGDSLQSPLPSTDAVEVQLLPMVANGGSDSFVEVQILFKVRKALRAVSLVLDSSGLLHPVLKEPDLARWPHNNWRNQEVLGQAYAEYSDELIFAVTPHTYLITGGKFVITYALDDGRDTVIDPGQYTFRRRSRLPIGTRAGRYTLHVLPGSEVLLGSGELASPTVVGPGELVVEKDVTEGYDEGIPPLQLDPQHRQVLGKVEFRLADANSRPAVPGGPLATAFPGEEFKVRVQMRTEMPLNQVSYVIQWPGQGLLCSSGALTNLFVNPEDGLNYEPHSFFHNVCASDASRGFIQVLWHLAGADDRNTPENYPGRPLEYFKPLGEWVDLTEILLSMDPDAAGGQDIPFQFIPYSARSGSEPEPPMFVPYQSTWPCYGNREPEGDYWSYDVRHESSFVRVLGKQPPPPAPDLGIRFKLGDVEAMPGETVEVPILASSEGPLSLLRLALEADPQAVAVESVDMAVQVEETGEVRRMVIPRGGRRNLLECHDDDNDGKPDRCDHGVPFLTLFAETEASFVLVDAVLLSGDPREYPGSSPFEIGRLHVRIREDATGHGTVLKPARVSFVENGLPVIGESGGYGTDPDDAGKFSPSVEVAGGKITFSVGQRSFVRGNANADEKVDLSDAVKILGYLFLGNTGLSCLDAADADDSGGLSITDPIYLLGFLFLGRQSIPEPYPACGTDPTTDELGCRQGCP